MAYYADWLAAKKKFTDSTGLDKIAKTIKIPLVGTFRKTTSIGASFRKIDEFKGESLEILSDKQLGKLGQLAVKLTATKTKYLRMLDAEITRTKDIKHELVNGDRIYRSMKIFKATLNEITSRVEREINSERARREADRAGLEGKANSSYQSLRRSIVSGKTACAAAVKVGQQILAEPTPLKYTEETGQAARNITQMFNNILKHAYPDQFAIPRVREETIALLNDNPALGDLARRIGQAIDHIRENAIAIAAETGNDAYTASLGRLAGNPVSLGEAPTDEDVKRAVKHFLRQVKTAYALLQETEQQLG